MTESLTHTPEISHHREWAPFPVLRELPTCADVAGGSKQPFSGHWRGPGRRDEQPVIPAAPQEMSVLVVVLTA